MNNLDYIFTTIDYDDYISNDDGEVQILSLPCNGKWVGRVQCDQMAILFFQYLAIARKKICPKSYKIAKAESKFLQILNRPRENGQRIFTFS